MLISKPLLAIIMRIKTPVVNVGNVKIGGQNPIVIQSMTNTDTVDVSVTAKQCMELADAGAELIRIAVDNIASAKAVPKIRKILDKKGYKNLPLAGDFHFNGHILLSKYPKCAEILDKYRINPGNVGNDKNFIEIVKIAIKNNKPIRIGANSGSIETMVENVLRLAKLARKIGLPQNKIILSVKMSDVQDVIAAYELLSARMKNHPYALHLGLTEAGSGLKGIISSSAALAVLLQKGIGNTIRISLTPLSKASRKQEIEICKILLQSIGLRYFTPQVISCPGCGRTNNKLFQEITKKINSYIDKMKIEWQKKYPDSAKLKIAIMGCVVNGPGEAKHSDIALILPGKTEKPIAQIYIKGKFFKNLTGKNIYQKFINILENYLAKSLSRTLISQYQSCKNSIAEQ